MGISLGCLFVSALRPRASTDHILFAYMSLIQGKNAWGFFYFEFVNPYILKRCRTFFIGVRFFSKYSLLLNRIRIEKIYIFWDVFLRFYKIVVSVYSVSWMNGKLTEWLQTSIRLTPFTLLYLPVLVGLFFRYSVIQTKLKVLYHFVLPKMSYPKK